MSKNMLPPKLQFDYKYKPKSTDNQLNQVTSSMISSSQETYNNHNDKSQMFKYKQKKMMYQSYLPSNPEKDKYKPIKPEKLSDMDVLTSKNSNGKYSIDSEKDPFNKDHKIFIQSQSHMTSSNQQQKKKTPLSIKYKRNKELKQKYQPTQTVKVFEQRPRKISLHDKEYQPNKSPYTYKPFKIQNKSSKQKFKYANNQSLMEKEVVNIDNTTHQDMLHQKNTSSKDFKFKNYQITSHYKNKKSDAAKHTQPYDKDKYHQHKFNYQASWLPPKAKKEKIEPHSQKKINYGRRTITKTNDKRPFDTQVFIVLKKLGEGSYGQVFLVIQQKTKTLYAIKSMSKQKVKSSDNEINIFRELKIHSYLDHRNIIQLYSTFADHENIYLLMQYCQGGSLFSFFKRDESHQPLLCSEKMTSNIIKQLCEAVLSMHKENIIHRDLKLENIMFTNNFVKLGDFGCAVHSFNLRSTTIGTRAYHSPQQLKSNLYDQKVDIWSIGIILYELLVGVTPYDNDILKILNKENKDLSELQYPKNCSISRQAKQLIGRLLTKNPNRRISLIQTLNHPFITFYNKTDEEKL